MSAKDSGKRVKHRSSLRQDCVKRGSDANSMSRIYAASVRSPPTESFAALA